MISTLSAAGSSSYLNRIERHAADTQQAIERISTGKRINRPADDPAGFVAAEELRGEIFRLTTDVRNIRRERNLNRIKSSGLSSIRDKLVELRGQLTEAAGNLVSDEQRQAYSALIDDSLQSLARIEKWVDDLAARHGAVGPAASQARAIQNAVQQAPDLERKTVVIERGIDSASSSLAALAAHEKYDLDLRQALDEDMLVKHTEALSQIEDADFAVETANLATSQVLGNAAMLALNVRTSVYAEQIRSLIDGVGEGLDATA